MTKALWCRFQRVCVSVLGAHQAKGAPNCLRSKVYSRAAA